MRPEPRAKGTGSPEKPAPSERGLGAGAGAQALAGGAPTIAGLRATAGLDVLREALEALARIVRARGGTYINIDASDVLFVDVVPDYRNGSYVSVYLLLRGGIEVEASELDGHVRVRSIHECYCGE